MGTAHGEDFMTSAILAKGNSPFLNNARISLYTGGIASILASVCCIGPFLLIILGFSSSTILYLITLTEWSRPFFIVVALVSLLLSYQRIWLSAPTRKSSKVCVNPQVRMTYKVFFFIIVMLVVVMLMLPNIISSFE